MSPASIVIMGACGRMGGTIRQLAPTVEGFKIGALMERPEKTAELKASVQDPAILVGSDLAEVLPKLQAPLLIDFTAPEASLASARQAAKHGASQVIGTTGLNDEQKKELAELAEKTRIFWSPNMSVGINVLLKVLPELTSLLGEDYDLEMVELHHKKKKDSPSGTALRLAESLAEARGWNLADSARYHREGIIGERPHKEIGLQTIRGGDVVGVHTIYFMGPGERIELTHQAHSRENFAQGALRAAGWLLKQQPGKLYTMQDIF